MLKAAIMLGACGLTEAFGHQATPTKAGGSINCGLMADNTVSATLAGNHLFSWGITAQSTEEAIAHASKILADNNYDLSDVVLAKVLVADQADVESTIEAMDSHFPSDQRPAIAVVNSGLCDGVKVTLSITAAKGEKTYVPKGVRSGDYAYVAGFPTEGEYVDQLDAIEKHLSATGLGTDDWVDYILNMPALPKGDAVKEVSDQIIGVNGVLNPWVPEHGGKDFPAMSAVNHAAPTWMSEIIAHSTHTGELTAAPTKGINFGAYEDFLAPFSPAVVTEDIIFLSGYASYGDNVTVQTQVKDIVDYFKTTLAKVNAKVSDVVAVSFMMNENRYKGESTMNDLMTEFNKQMGDSPRSVTFHFVPVVFGNPTMEIGMQAAAPGATRLTRN